MVPARIAQALAPWLFGMLLDRWGAGALWLSAALGLAAFAALLLLRAQAPVAATTTAATATASNATAAKPTVYRRAPSETRRGPPFSSPASTPATTCPRPTGRSSPNTATCCRTHRGWDPGALLLAREMVERFDARLYFETTTRLLVDLNRSVGNPELHSEATRHLLARRAARDPRACTTARIGRRSTRRWPSSIAAGRPRRAHRLAQLHARAERPRAHRRHRPAVRPGAAGRGGAGDRVAGRACERMRPGPAPAPQLPLPRHQRRRDHRCCGAGIPAERYVGIELEAQPALCRGRRAGLAGGAQTLVDSSAAALDAFAARPG